MAKGHSFQVGQLVRIKSGYQAGAEFSVEQVQKENEIVILNVHKCLLAYHFSEVVPADEPPRYTYSDGVVIDHGVSLDLLREYAYVKYRANGERIAKLLNDDERMQRALRKLIQTLEEDGQGQLDVVAEAKDLLK